MNDKLEMIEKLTGIRSSKQSYYRQLVKTVEELQTKNQQLQVMINLSKIPVNHSWEDISQYIAKQLSDVLHFSVLILSIANESTKSKLYHFIAQEVQRSWQCTQTLWTPKRFDSKIMEFSDLAPYHVDSHLIPTILPLRNQLHHDVGFLTLLSSEPLDESELIFSRSVGNYVGVSIENILLFKDLQDKVDLEAQLIQSAKLAAIGEMAAGVAHELNSPLTAILGDTQLLLRKQGGSPSQPLLQDILQCGLRSKKIIDNLLTFARRDEQTFENVSLNELVENVLGLIRYQIETFNIEIQLNCDPSIPDCHANRHQIEQVLINLLLNARDAVQDRKTKLVRIITGTKTIQNKVFVFVSVWDNGVGIKDEHKDQIFQPFFTTKERFKGTGLGLSVSHGIARSHGGSLDLESSYGNFSEFTISIPSTSDEG